MDINIAMGVYCPKCKMTIGTYAVVGGKANCPVCNSELMPAPAENQTKIISNFKCDCGFQIGHLSVVGGKASCPGCGKDI